MCPQRLQEQVAALRQLREERKELHRRPRRFGLSATQRKEILQKTDAKCHICGGDIEGEWHADHILAHSAGGKHSVNNYLPAHALCNNYRWDYLPEEFEIIMKLGVWARTEVEKGTKVGKLIEEKYTAYDNRRTARRKHTSKP